MSTPPVRKIHVHFFFDLNNEDDSKIIEQTVKKIFPQAHIKISPSKLKTKKIKAAQTEDPDLLACTGTLLFVSVIANVVLATILLGINIFS